MRRRYLFTSAGVVLVIAVVAGTYLAGIQIGRGQGREAYGQLLASVQADLGLTKLQRLRELEGDLSRGCAKEALAKLRFDIHTQLYVLSSLYREHKGTWVMNYLEKRDTTILEQLKTFKRKHDPWTEPKCVS